MPDRPFLFFPRVNFWFLCIGLMLSGSSAVSAVDFHHEIEPILRDRCSQCHMGEKHKGGFSMNTKASFLKGSEEGKVVIPGHAEASELVIAIQNPDLEYRMPPKGDALAPDQIGLIIKWINEGLEWPDGFAFQSVFQRADLAPRLPDIPDHSLPAPVDRLMVDYYARHNIKPGPLVDDATYARRVFMDLIGLAPTTEELKAFVSEKDIHKRERLVDALLARDVDYADHWLSFWNDLLRNAYLGPGFIDGGRKQITPWLYRALMENKAYDQFAQELISGSSGSEGFIDGIKWRGNVNESQRKEIQAVQNVFQVFMGSNMKCASCHDSFINDWKLDDTIKMAAVFAKDNALEVYRCDKATGRIVRPAFLYPELGTLDPLAPREARMQQTAQLLTQKKNGRLSRTMVNRYWARLLGRGLIEPVDEMDRAAWNQDLLDYLAYDFAEHAYDLKRLLKTIATSDTYQRPSNGQRQTDPDKYVFRGPEVKRLSAEQFLDRVSVLTETWIQPTKEMSKNNGGRGTEGHWGVIARVREELGAPPIEKTRTAYSVGDTLLSSLGLSNREQVISNRTSEPTLLQSLELSNGKIFNDKINQGATVWAEKSFTNCTALAGAIYLQAYGREPIEAEREAAGQLLGAPDNREGIADLLWAITMTPEFQLIH